MKNIIKRADCVKDIVKVLKESGIDEKYIAAALFALPLVPMTLEYVKSIVHDVLEHEGAINVELGKFKFTAGKISLTELSQSE